jgi:hypothetical protein
MEIDALALGVFLVSQALQTLQLWAVSRKVSRTLMPPPILPPPPAAINPFCLRCGTLTHPAELSDGLCARCLGTTPTDRPYADPHAATLRRRR